MKPKYKLYVKEDIRLVNPLLYNITGENGELLCRIEGWNGNHGGGSEYRLLNGDFSDAGSTYRIFGGSSSYATIFGMVVSGSPIAYRVFLNDFKKEVRYNPSITGGTYTIEDINMRVDALLQDVFWLYDVEKEIAKMKRKWFHVRKTYVISVYDENIPMDTVMGAYIGVLAIIGDQKGREYNHYHH